MHVLYPDFMTDNLLFSISYAIDHNSIEDFHFHMTACSDTTTHVVDSFIIKSGWSYGADADFGGELL